MLAAYRPGTSRLNVTCYPTLEGGGAGLLILLIVIRQFWDNELQITVLLRFGRGVGRRVYTRSFTIIRAIVNNMRMPNFHPVRVAKLAPSRSAPSTAHFMIRRSTGRIRIVRKIHVHISVANTNKDLLQQTYEETFEISERPLKRHQFDGDPRERLLDFLTSPPFSFFLISSLYSGWKSRSVLEVERLETR